MQLVFKHIVLGDYVMTSPADRYRLLGAMLGAAALTLAALPADAQQSSARVRTACSPDAKRLCGKHDMDSPDLRKCMEDKGSQLSKACIKALEDDGLIPRGWYAGQ